MHSAGLCLILLWLCYHILSVLPFSSTNIIQGCNKKARSSHTEADTKWPPFRKRHFQMYFFFNEIVCHWVNSRARGHSNVNRNHEIILVQSSAAINYNFLHFVARSNSEHISQPISATWLSLNVSFDNPTSEIDHRMIQAQQDAWPELQFGQLCKLSIVNMRRLFKHQ